jgi:hypothetical protein
MVVVVVKYKLYIHGACQAPPRQEDIYKGNGGKSPSTTWRWSTSRPGATISLDRRHMVAPHTHLASIISLAHLRNITGCNIIIHWLCGGRFAKEEGSQDFRNTVSQRDSAINPQIQPALATTWSNTYVWVLPVLWLCVFPDLQLLLCLYRSCYVALPSSIVSPKSAKYLVLAYINICAQL